MTHQLVDGRGKAVAIEPVTKTGFKDWLKKRRAADRAWIEENGFVAKPGRFIALPSARGGIGTIVLGVHQGPDIWSWGDLSTKLPVGRYRIEGRQTPLQASAAALGWALGSYRFTRYLKPGRKLRRTGLAGGCRSRRASSACATSVFLVRDLINTPAEDMGPPDLAEAARDVAKAARREVPRHGRRRAAEEELSARSMRSAAPRRARRG